VDGSRGCDEEAAGLDRYFDSALPQYAIFGEQIVLSVRYGNWSEVNVPAQAANWARFWRAEIQGYIHAYRAATAVDLTMDIHDVKEAAQRYLPPSVHLRNRMSRQMQNA
jgi:hypothetical protein